MKHFKAQILLIHVLVIANTFCLGTILAVYSGIADGQGLAGPAIAMSYGLFASIGALVFSIWGVGKLNPAQLNRLNKWLAFIFAILFTIGMIRFYLLGKSTEEQTGSNLQEKTPLGFFHLSTKKPIRNAASTQDLGIGMFSPRLGDNRVIKFYSISDHLFENGPAEPIDSMTIELGDYGYSIVQAPPWLVPVHSKLDYELLYFKAVSITNEYVEIEVNSKDGRTSFVKKSDGLVFEWTQFLLRVHSVEAIDVQTNPTRIKPLDHSSEIQVKWDILQPIRITDEWIMVAMYTSDYELLRTGWVRWRKDNELVIRYSLLS